MIDAAQVHPTFFWHSSLLMHEYPSKDWVNPDLQLPHNTPLRLPLQRLSLVRTSGWNVGENGGSSRQNEKL
jgi:hypothetical protein